jgi:glycosyltransferase involved in cell wall biosynthesis
MKILHVIPSFVPTVRYGGPIVAVHQLARAQARLCHEVVVATTLADGDQNLDIPAGQPVAMEGFTVRYFAPGWPRRLYRAPGLSAYLHEAVVHFNVVHLHSVFLWPTLAAARFAAAHRVPYVLSPRGMLVKDLIRRKSTLAKNVWIRLFERRTIERAAAIHVTSRMELDDLRAFGFALPPAEVVPNGIEAGAASGARPRRGAPPTILFIGRLNWKKGLDRLIPAMTHVRDARLVIAGNDEEQYRPELERLALQHGVRDRVEFFGFAGAADKQALLARASLLVLPSYSENFGNVVLEAMAAGCPVVVTPEVGLAETVTRVGAGLVVDGKPEILGPALRGLLDDPAMQARCGQAGREAVLREFTWESVARAMSGLYDRARGHSAPHQSPAQ